MEYAARQFAATVPDRSFFYSSGRSSNEAGFLLQLLARVYGTNNINNCSYYCHQATSVGLSTTIGSGTATVELEDLSGCDLVFVIGANPSSNHPRFIHKLKACRDRGGQVIVINPAKEPGLVKFAVPKSPSSMIAGGTEIASCYLQPNIGGDIALFKGIAKAIIASGDQYQTFIEQYCADYAPFLADIEITSWQSIVAVSGVSQAEIEHAAALYSQSKNAVFAWGMGMTHHQFGCNNVEYIANLALLRGMVGKRYAGLLPLRGHSNVQGIGTIGVKPVLAADILIKIERELGVTLPRTPGLDTFHALKAAQEGRIDAACIVGGNLYSASPDSTWSEAALNKIGFKLFLTTTLNQGHLYGNDNSNTLILPVCARDEEAQPTTQESMFNYVRLSDGGIQRLQNVRSEVSILAELGKRLLPDSALDFDSFTQHDSIREVIAKTIPGLEDLKDISIAKKEFHVRGRIKHRPEFSTPDNKAHFITHCMPERECDVEAFPFTLASIRSEGQFNSIIYEELDSYRYRAHRHALLMSPDDIRTLGYHIGDRVNVYSPTGKMPNLEIFAFDLPPGNVMAYYPEANVLTSGNLDERSKTPAFKSVAVRIERV